MIKFNSKNITGLAFICLLLGGLVVSCNKIGSLRPLISPPVVPPPAVVPVQVSGISPVHGPGGTVVTITGSNFSNTTSLDTVYFNGKAAVVTSASDTALQVTVPVTAGTGNVTVRVNGTMATGPSFTYDYQWMVTTFAGTAGVQGSADGTGSKASFWDPFGIVVDGSGNLYVADYFNESIRMITANGVVSTIYHYVTYPAGVVLDGKGSLYISLNTPYDFIDKLNLATGITTPISGAGRSGFQNNPPAGYALFGEPYGMAIDKSGNVYVADATNNLIRVITSATGATSTYAGFYPNYGALNGPGSTATFKFPAGLAFDVSGNLYVADVHNNLIRKIAPDTTVSTFAGNGNPGYADSTGVAASFSNPVAIAADSKGNLYVADENNYVIRMITPAGVVTTIAGSGNAGSADGAGPKASFKFPDGIACDANGTLWVSDGGNNTIRKIILQ